MKHCVLAVSLLFACTGPTTHPVLEPERVDDAKAEAATASSQCGCSDQTQTCSSPTSGPSKAAIIPPGFWCSESRETANGPPLNVCYSTADTCNRLRKEGQATGILMSVCRSRESAYCFTMTDADGQRVHWRCYESMAECLPLREKAMSQQPTLPFSECSGSSSVMLPEQSVEESHNAPARTTGSLVLLRLCR